MRFFITRPIFASALALIMTLLGAVSMVTLPIAHFPPLAPPQVQVSVSYVGASAEVVEDTVTTPLEEQLNGAEGMLYMSSSSTNSGDSIITATFEVGTDPNIAQMEMLARTTEAIPYLPPVAQQAGVSVDKASTSVLMAVNLFSPGGTYDGHFLQNYADIHVADPIARIPGIASVQNLGLNRYAMRVWIDPQKLNNLGLTAGDVEKAILEQNRPAPLGKIGEAPAPPGRAFELQLNTEGRLTTVEEFENIVVRALADGSVVRLRDVGRVERGSEDYDWSTSMNGKPTASLTIFQLADANGLDIHRKVVETLNRLERHFPDDVEWTSVWDSTLFLRESIREVALALLTAIALVLLVIFIFLQNARSTLIPMIAVPVSLIGTFAAMPILGFSINSLTMLGLVVAVALVVDDAIVVVENVNRRLAEGGEDLEQVTAEAMDEVRGPILATTLVLVAVFVPVAFIPGVTGRLYNQFALTVAVAVALSGFNSLTLSPALCATFLRTDTAREVALLGPFNRAFERTVNAYAASVAVCARYWPAIVVGFLGLCALAGYLFFVVPKGFVPQEDEGAVIMIAELPAASTVDRTEAVLQRLSEIAHATEGIANVNAVSGFSLVDNVKRPSAGMAYANLDPWNERTTAETSLAAITARLQAAVDEVPGVSVTVASPPTILGLGATSGFSFELQDLDAAGPQALAAVSREFIEQANARPELSRIYTSFDAEVPQRRVEVDRVKAKTRGVSIEDIFETLQLNFGALWVNQYNEFGRVYWVYIQAEKDSRAEQADIARLKVRNADGQMINLSAFVTVHPMVGPYDIQHYDMYGSARINGFPSPGYSTGQAVDAMEEVAERVLPGGFGYQWTDLVYQQKQSGNVAPLVFGLSLALVFLVLAAQYESWTMPVTILLSIPLGMLGAVGALILRGMDLDVFGQIGLLVLIGLVAKNAILIVEFARKRRQAGAGALEAATQAARLRLRPILMTALAFIVGLLPLAFANGAGSVARRSLGTVLVGGLLLATVLIIVVPVFYYVIERRRESHPRRADRAAEA